MIEVYFDGSCEPNPGGIVRYGAIIRLNEIESYEICKRVNLPSSVTTNNVAEYCALIACLKYLIHTNHNLEKIICYGDSQLVINTITGRFSVNKGKKYASFYYIAQGLLHNFSDISFQWIPRELNYIADNLSRKAA